MCVCVYNIVTADVFHEARLICWAWRDETLPPHFAAAFWQSRKKEEEEMGKKNKKKTVAGRLERAGADGEGEKKKRERLMEKDRALEEGGEMLNRCGGGRQEAERESKRYWHGRNWGKRGFTFHLNGMMSSARRQGGGTARAPEALRWSCVQHKYFAISNPSIQGDTLITRFVFLFPPSALFCLSPALDAIIALLMRRHMGDIWSLRALGTVVCVLLYARVCVFELMGSFN